MKVHWRNIPAVRLLTAFCLPVMCMNYSAADGDYFGCFFFFFPLTKLFYFTLLFYYFVSYY